MTENVWERQEDTVLVAASIVLGALAAWAGTLFVETHLALLIGLAVWMAAFGLFWPRIVEVGFSRWET